MVGECCRHLPYIEPAEKITANPIQGLVKGFVKMTENQGGPQQARDIEPMLG